MAIKKRYRDEGKDLMDGFIPTREELEVLARLYVDEVQRLYWLEYACYMGSLDRSDAADGIFYCRRLKRIEKHLDPGDFRDAIEELDKKLVDGLEEYKKKSIVCQQSGAQRIVKTDPECLRCNDADIENGSCDRLMLAEV